MAGSGWAVSSDRLLLVRALLDESTPREELVGVVARPSPVSRRDDDDDDDEDEEDADEEEDEEEEETTPFVDPWDPLCLTSRCPFDPLLASIRTLSDALGGFMLDRANSAGKSGIVPPNFPGTWSSSMSVKSTGSHSAWFVP